MCDAFLLVLWILSPGILEELLIQFPCDEMIDEFCLLTP